MHIQWGNNQAITWQFRYFCIFSAPHTNTTQKCLSPLQNAWPFPLPAIVISNSAAQLAPSSSSLLIHSPSTNKTVFIQNQTKLNQTKTKHPIYSYQSPCTFSTQCFMPSSPISQNARRRNLLPPDQHNSPSTSKNPTTCRPRTSTMAV